jgi:outer membrane protein
MTRPLQIGALLLAVSSAAAEAQTTVRLTVDEAIGRAVQVSHRLAEATARVEGAEAQVRTREAADRPTVAVSAGYTRTNNVVEFRVLQPTGPMVIYPNLPDNFFTRLGLQWPIYSAGRTEALRRAAEAEVRASAADRQTAQADLKLEVVQTYWGLATATETLRVVAEAVARADAHVRDVRAQFDAGLVPPNDVASAEAQRSREAMLEIEARNARAGMLQELRRLTAITEDIELVERLEATLPPGADPGVFAVAARAERQAMVDRILAADERRRSIEAGRRPTLAVTGMVDYANPNRNIFPVVEGWRESWQVGVTSTWTLWDGGRIDAEASEAGAAATAARARLAELESLIALDVRQRQLDLDSARAALVSAVDSVRSAGEARRVVAERFNVGVATSTELLDAEVALLEAELGRTRTFANIRLAEARLDRALGR